MGAAFAAFLEKELLGILNILSQLSQPDFFEPFKNF
jgi:hypothetical protein